MMETGKQRRSKRNRSKQAAITFLTNITLGNENECKELSKLHIPPRIENEVNTLCTSPGAISCDASSVGSNSRNGKESLGSLSRENFNTSYSSLTRRHTVSSYYDPLMHNDPAHYRTSSNSDSSTEVVEHRKLTRDDSERPIASEKIRKKSDTQQDDNEANLETSMSFMSVFRYYKGIIKRPKENKLPHHRSQEPYIQSYFHQQVMNNNFKHRRAISYVHFLSQSKEDPNSAASRSGLQRATYDPNYIEYDDDESTSFFQSSQTSRLYCFNKSTKDLFNEKFRKSHPEIVISLSKIRAIKSRMLSIGKSLDLEISSLAHSFAYFEKLLLKNIITKQNRKLIGACCLFLATKVNEPKGLDYQKLFDSVYSELYVSARDIKNHEFSVFADLEFDLYLPPCEFMPHFERIAIDLEIQSIEAYLGYADFYKMIDDYEK